MAVQSKSDTITMKLEQTISQEADRATGALGRLERQIAREESALGRLEKDLIGAKVKLDLLSQGAPSQKAVVAFERQSAAVDVLRGKLAQLEATGGKTGGVASKLAEAQAKLGGLRDAAKSSSVDVAAYKKSESAVASLTNKLGSQRDKIDALRDKTVKINSVNKTLTDTTALLGRETGVASSRMLTLGKDLATLGPYGAVAAAAILATVGAVAAFVSIVAKGISSSGKMRSELLQLQQASVSSTIGMHWLWNATHESRLGAERMQIAISRVNATSDAGRPKLAGYAAQIAAARFQGDKAEQVLRMMAKAGTGGFDDRAKEVLNWSRQIRLFGGNLDQLEKRIEQKFGKTARAQAIALDVQLRRLGENITWIFGGADIDPFLRALNSVLSLFNAGSKSATGMRGAITSMVEWSIGAMLRLGIHVLKAYIALRQHDTVWRSIVLGVKMAGIAFGFVGGAITAVVGVLLLIPPAIAAAEAAIVGAVGGLIRKVFADADKAQSAGSGLGTSIAMGTANGISFGTPAVEAAARKMAKAAESAARKETDSHSPSRKFFSVGHGGMAAGMAGGMHAGTPMVARAAVGMSRSAVFASRATVANDVGFRGGIGGGLGAQIGIGTQQHFGMGIPRQMTPQMQVPMQAPMPNGPKFEFHDCTFGGDLNEDKAREIMHAAFEAEVAASGRAA